MAVIGFDIVVIAVVMVGTATIGFIAWQQRPRPGTTTLSVLLWAISIWTASLLAAIVTSEYWLSRIAVNLVLTATAVTSAAFFAFALEYTGREQYLQWPYPLVLAIEPALVALLTFTNEIHWLFWRDVIPDANHYSGFAHPDAIGQLFHLGYTYVLTVAGIYFIVRKLVRSRAIHRSQTVAVLIAALAPLVGNALYVSSVLALGQVVGFGISSIALYWAVVRGKLIDLTPVARATVLEELESGVLVLDDRGRVTDINPHARQLLGIDPARDVIGQPIGAVLDDWGALVEEYTDRTSVDDIVTVTIDGDQRRLTLDLSPLTDDLGREVGRLVLFEDVTERQRRREELERQNERLEEFASMVSHDLRNPLDVASGYVELMRHSRAETDDGIELDVDKLDETVDALERIEAIVEDVLTLAREGRGATDPEAVSLRAAARTAWEHVDTAAAKLVVGTDDMIVADRDHLERLFENLFRNSIEHGGTDVTVSVGVIHENHERIGFYVEDDGPGIPEDQRDEIFESDVSGTEDGTGFGLAIVSKLATANGWTVTPSASDDGGARFEITGVEFTSESVSS